jgi:hypothetical protein
MTCVLTNLSFSASRSLNRLLLLGLMLLVVFRAFGPVAPSIDGHATDGPGRAIQTATTVIARSQSTTSRDGSSNLAFGKKV